jgi:two-component system, NtrC family, nitrogen regulation response regulator GlnG
MAFDADGDRNGNGSGMGMLARTVADAVPGIVEQLRAANNPRVHREALALLERPLLAHVLALTGGNQLRAARVLGLNRNTLRKRCRELSLPATRVVRRPRLSVAAPGH